MIVQDFPLAGPLATRKSEADSIVPDTGPATVFLALMGVESGIPPVLAEAAGGVPERVDRDLEFPIALDSISPTGAAPLWVTDGPVLLNDKSAGPPRDAVPPFRVAGTERAAAAEPASVAPSAIRPIAGGCVSAVSPQPVSVEDPMGVLGATPGIMPKVGKTAEQTQIAFRIVDTRPEGQTARTDGKLQAERTPECGDPPLSSAASRQGRPTNEEEPRIIGAPAVPSREVSLPPPLRAEPTETAGETPEVTLRRQEAPVPISGGAPEPAMDNNLEKRATPEAHSKLPASLSQDVGSSTSALAGSIFRAAMTEGRVSTLLEPQKPNAPSPDVASPEGRVSDRLPDEGTRLAGSSRDASILARPSSAPVLPVPPEPAQRSAAPLAYRGDPPGSPQPAMERPSLSSVSPTGAYTVPLPSSDGAPIPGQAATEITPGWLREAEEGVPSQHSADMAVVRRGSEIAGTSGGQASAEPVRNVAIQLVAAVSAGAEGAIEIRLSPEELGRVTLTIQVTDDSVVLAIQAERQDTLDLMRRHADILQREFRESGFTSLSFSFGQDAPGRQGTHASAETAVSDDRKPQSASQHVLTTSGSAPASSRLDLRL